MGKFINPFTDLGFKRIFGQEFSKPVLVAFLNALLEGERRIVDLKYLDKEKVGLADSDRSLIYDVLCQTDTGEYVIVEMQQRSQAYFKDRSIYYVSRSIVEQGVQGRDWQYNIKAVYFIALLSFKMKDAPEQLRIDVALMDMKIHTVFSDKIRMVFLQLPFFNKEVDDCTNDFERFLYVLKNMDILQRMPFEAQNATFKRMGEIAEFAALNEDERRQYEHDLKAFRDTNAVMDYTYNEGVEVGKALDEAEILTILEKRGVSNDIIDEIKNRKKSGNT